MAKRSGSDTPQGGGWKRNGRERKRNYHNDNKNKEGKMERGPGGEKENVMVITNDEEG